MILNSIFGPDKIPAYKLHRASQLGLSEQELYSYFTDTKERKEPGPHSVLYQGTLLHKIFQATKSKAGVAKGIEKFVYDPEAKVTGHIDIFTMGGMLGDIKTVSPGRMQQVLKGGPFKKNISQLNLYLKATGTDVGFLQYVNRQNLEDQTIYKIKFDPELYHSDINKLNRVRARIDSELLSGALSPSDLKMTDTLEVRRSKALQAQSELKENISNLDELISEYKDITNYGEFSEGKVWSNRPFRRIHSRRASNSIRGLQEGWFGSQRKENTSFGSPWNWKNISPETRVLFQKSTALDIETTGLQPKYGDVTVQLGLAGPYGKVKQYTVTDIISQRNKIKTGKIASKILNDISKQIGLNNQQVLAGYQSKGLMRDIGLKNYKRQKVSRDKLLSITKKLGDNLAKANNPIIIHNLEFERRFLKSQGVELPVDIEYDKIVKNSMKELDDLRQEYERSLIGLPDAQKKARYSQWIEDNFKTNLKFSRNKFNFFRKALKEKRATVIDTQEMARYAIGLLQEKGVIPKTYDIFTGSKVEHLAKGFFDLKEPHFGDPDAWLERHLAPRLYDFVEQAEKPDFTISKIKSGQGWVKDLQANAQFGWKQEAIRKRVESHFEEINKFGFTELEKRYHKAGVRFTSQEGLINFLQHKPETLFYGSTYPEIKSTTEKILTELTGHKIAKESEFYKKIPAFLKEKPSMVVPVAAGLIAGGALLYNLFSGHDDDYNTIEGLKHGWFGKNRSYYTDFGSGYIPPDPTDPTPVDLGKIAGFGAMMVALHYFWNKPVNFFGNGIDIRSLSYMGLVPGVKLGRTAATYGDIVYNSLRRFEYMFGGIPKTFSLSAMLSPTIYKNAEYTFEIASPAAKNYANYLNKLTGRNLVEEGIRTVEYRSGKLYARRGAELGDVLLEEAKLVQRTHDINVAKAPSQFSESLMRTRGISGGLNTAEFPLLVTGGSTKVKANMEMLHGFVHETLSKYLRLMDDPFRVIKDVFSIQENRVTKAAQGALKYLPKLGVGGEAALTGTVPELLGRHARTFIPKVLAIPFALGMANWAVRELSPDDTIAGEAGLTGIGAWAIKTAHLTSAKVSDITGATAVRKYFEEQAPGSTGLFPWFGLISSGAITGGLIGGAQNLFDEVISHNRYGTLIENIGREAVKPMPNILNKIPGFAGEYGRAGRYARFGALAGGVLGLSFALAGIGTKKSYEELRAEYEGQTEVPIYKGRWWEFGLCVTKSSIISRNYGIFSRAADIKIGDKILTKSGQRKKVLSITERELRNSEIVYSIKTSIDKSGFPQELTENHPVLTPNGWKEIKDINIGDSVAFPKPELTNSINEYNGIPFTKETGFLVGHFLAEGNLMKKRGEVWGIELCASLKEFNYLDKDRKVINQYWNKYNEIKEKKGNGVYRLRPGSKELGSWFQSFLYWSNDKLLPTNFLDFNIEFLRGLIEGYFSGNGGFNGGMICITSARYELLKQIQAILFGLNIPTLLNDNSGFSKQVNKWCNSWRLNFAISDWFGTPKAKRKFIKIDETYVWAVLWEKKIIDYSDTVLDFEIEDEHSFVGTGIILHNTPWKGQNIQYFRPNWYQRLKSGYKEKAIYNEENISPLTKVYKDITDPYWVEKMNYENRPYPIAGPSGESLGIFGSLYEWSLGRIIKPPVLMHTEEMGEGPTPPMEPGLEPSMALGGLPAPEPMSPYSAAQQLQQQYYSTYEAMGLRGFIAASTIEKFKGERELFTYKPILQPSSDIESPRRSFWDLNLGGGLGTTEFLRRFIPRRTADFDYVNPIPNQMPSWLPSEDYYINFHLGDIYSRIPEGEYRLPGKGYEARYPELEGVSPEKYPEIHKYKILSDVAMYSNEFRKEQKKMQKMYQSGRLDEESANIFAQTEEQIKLKKQKKEFRQSSDSMLAKYYTSITDVARANPLEQLLPIAPAHKFLPAPDPLKAYKETIYGREFKLWEHPIEHFIKPALSTIASDLGWEGIPEDVRTRRHVEDYFDKLQYIKARRLEKEATSEKDRDAYLKATNMASSTLTGVNPYGYPSRLLRAMPSRERPYFLQFVNAPEKQREEILKLVPESMRDIYLAQWDKDLLERTESGEIEANDEEIVKIKEEITTRQNQMRMRRRAELDKFMQSENLPDENWIGWRADVDLSDVKLKYILDQGEDYHYYNLWENRLRSLSRKPYLEEAVQQIEIPREKTNYQKLYKIAEEAGIENPNIGITTGLNDSVSIDLEQDRDDEIDYWLRRGRHIS